MVCRKWVTNCYLFILITANGWEPEGAVGLPESRGGGCVLLTSPQKAEEKDAFYPFDLSVVKNFVEVSKYRWQ